MILTVDVGNTNIVLGGFEGESLRFVARLQTNKYTMPDEYAVKLDNLIRFYGFTPSQFEGTMLSSVVPPLTATLRLAIGQLLPGRILTVSPGTKTGLDIQIDNPAVLGADLVCGAVAALHRYPLPCVVVDLGTATKFSVLDGKGRLQGVSILAGVRVSLDALCQNTAQLPHIDFSEPGPVIGKNTPDSMRSGVLYGTASMIDGMLGRIEAELGEPLASVVATGGIAESILPYCQHTMSLDPQLVLHGLRIIHEKNRR